MAHSILKLLLICSIFNCNNTEYLKNEKIMNPKLIFKKITIPNKGEVAQGLKILDNRNILIISGNTNSFSNEENWRVIGKISLIGLDKLISFLNNKLSKIASIPYKNKGVIHYYISTNEKNYELVVDNINYNKLPNELIELEKIINGNIETK